jgi:hypothetical protein
LQTGLLRDGCPNTKLGKTAGDSFKKRKNASLSENEVKHFKYG